MKSKQVTLTLLAAISFLLAVAYHPADAAISVRGPRACRIAEYIWYNRFSQAVDSAQALVEAEKDNPTGYFLLGVIYHSISNQYRSDRYRELIERNLDTAIVLAQAKIKSAPADADWYLVLGSAYGYRALHRSLHGGGWGSFKDGSRSSSQLEKSLALDSTCYDAYFGLGAFHYWKSVKVKKLAWLPFVSDRRQQGIDEIIRSIGSGSLAPFNARKTLLAIFLNEKRYEDFFPLADSLMQILPDDPSCLHHLIVALMNTERWDEAEKALTRLRAVWSQSPYFDSAGALDGNLLAAQIAFGRGDRATAAVLVDNILAVKTICRTNDYCTDTYEQADRLRKKLH
jgi:tetratricopeptide (TPR) repeat protein